MSNPFCTALHEGPCSGWAEDWPWHGCVKPGNHASRKRAGSPKALHECKCGKTWHGTIVYTHPVWLK